MRAIALAIVPAMMLSACRSVLVVSSDSERLESGLVTDASPTVPCTPMEWFECACDDGATGAAECTAQRTFGACECPPPSCVEGTSRACRCDGGSMGARRCSSGRFEACACSPRLDAGADDVPRTDGSPDDGAEFDAPSGDGSLDLDSGVVDAADVTCETPPEGCRPLTCAFHRVSCGLVPDGCGCFLDCGTCRDGLQTLALRVNHVVADRARRRYYATISDDEIGLAGSIAIINPDRPWDFRTMPIGANPNTIALSDDATTLWVGLDGDLALRRIDVYDGSEPLLVAGPVNPIRARTRDIAFLPGRRGSVVATLFDDIGANYVSTRVFDDGIARPLGLAPYECTSSLATGFGATVFAFDGCGGLGTLRVLDITSAGLSGHSFDGLANYFAGQIAFDAPYLFVSDGSMIDVADLSHPFLAGRFDAQGTFFSDVARDRIYFVTSPAYMRDATFRRYSVAGRVLQSSSPLRGVTGEYVRDLTRIARGEFAFVASWTHPRGSGTLYLLHGAPE